MNNVAKLKEDPQPPASLAAAMAVAFGEIDSATKGAQGQVGQQKYKYADLTAVIDAIKPALIRNGLFFTQCPEPSDKGVTIETVLHHAAGEHMTLGKLFVPANKQDAQAYGSALTYARRYALVTAFGVPVEDDDGKAASAAPAQQAKQEQLISDASWAMLVQLIDHPDAKTTTDKVCQAKNVESLRDLTEEAARAVIQTLRKRLKDAAKGRADA